MDSPDPAFLAVDLDDAGGNLLVGLQVVLHLVNAVLADLGDVDEPVDAVLQFNEGAERGHLGDLALHDVPDLEEAVDVGPGIDGQLLHSEADALLLRVDVEHDRVDLVALLQDFGGDD